MYNNASVDKSYSNYWILTEYKCNFLEQLLTIIMSIWPEINILFLMKQLSNIDVV